MAFHPRFRTSLSTSPETFVEPGEKPRRIHKWSDGENHYRTPHLLRVPWIPFAAFCSSQGTVSVPALLNKFTPKHFFFSFFAAIINGLVGLEVELKW
jgi:hypothetical protein